MILFLVKGLHEAVSYGDILFMFGLDGFNRNSVSGFRSIGVEELSNGIKFCFMDEEGIEFKCYLECENFKLILE